MTRLAGMSGRVSRTQCRCHGVLVTTEDARDAEKFLHQQILSRDDHVLTKDPPRTQELYTQLDTDGRNGLGGIIISPQGP